VRQSIKDFVSIVSVTIPIIEPIYEFGALQVPDQVVCADLRPLFSNMEYVGCDMRVGLGVDKILNLHSIDVPSESVGTVFCFDTLEHVEYPHKAINEVFRILKPNGVAVISSVMNFPIHEFPHDYWRFTPEAFRSILKPFSHSFVGYQGNEQFPHTVVGIGFKTDTEIPEKFTEKYYDWQRKDRRSLRQIVLRLAPPMFLPAIAGIFHIAKRR